MPLLPSLNLCWKTRYAYDAFVHTSHSDYNFFFKSILLFFGCLCSYISLSLVLISILLSYHENELQPLDVRYLYFNDWWFNMYAHRYLQVATPFLFLYSSTFCCSVNRSFHSRRSTWNIGMPSFLFIG